MLISKKDLLAETGISYGQLYRWKRAGLIPEEWFLKQSSYTGQETFFPREQILSRVHSVLDLKDKYTLDELAKILSPEVGEITFSIQDIEGIEEINRSFIHEFTVALNKQEFNFAEILAMIMISEASQKITMNEYQAGGLLYGIAGNLNDMHSTGYIFMIAENNREYFGILYADHTQIFMDKKLDVKYVIHMDEISNRIKLKYKQRFQFA